MNSSYGHNSRRTLIKQLFRYAIVGVISNAIAYLAYLLITSIGLSPKLAMSSLYVVGAIVGFAGNRHLTFAHSGGLMGSGARYVLTHAIGYLINLTILMVFVDHLNYPHQAVQAAAVLVVAAYLFFALKLFVFPSSDHHMADKS
jgi:putative flippase GtrA